MLPPNALELNSPIPPEQDGNTSPAMPPDWETWLLEATSDEVAIDWNVHFSEPPELSADMPEDDLARLDRLIEDAQAEMNTPDGSRRLDDLMEERGWLAEEMALRNGPESPLDVVDARFVGRPTLDADGNPAGVIIQYMEVYQNPDQPFAGRLLDVGHYATDEDANKVFQIVQEGIDDSSLRPEDMLYLAEALAESNGLPPDAYREMTPEDHARFDAKAYNPDISERDLPPDSVMSAAFTANLFTAITADPAFAAQEHARLSNDLALAALEGIGLAVQTDFDLARNSFYDAERGERLINGIFQQDPNDPTQNCRPMFVSLIVSENGLGYAAQAVEFGTIGSLSDVQADHGRVQTALEEGGISVGIETIQALDAEREMPGIQNAPPAPEVPAPSLEIS
jgi:hypothetical protein